MSKRRLLVLGASRYQLEVITKAKELGYSVIVADNVPENPGHRLADESFDISTTDVPAIVELARRVSPNGVVSPCTDVAVTTAACVAEALGLPGIPPASAKTLTSKILFRDYLVREGLPVPRFHVVSADAVGPDFEPSFPFPMVVKPDGSSGSKGIFIVRDREQLLDRLPVTLAFSPTQRGVVEEFIEGRQGTCEGVVVDGKVVFALVTDRETADPPFVVTAGHYVPSTIAPAARARTMALIERVLSNLAVRTSPFDCDFVICPDGVPYLLELTPRLGGNSLTRLVRESCGLDLADVAIRLACGERVAFSSDFVVRPTAQLILGTKRTGRLRYDTHAVRSLRAEPWVRELALDYGLEHPVEAFINGRTRVGEATVAADDRDELDRRVVLLKERIALDATP